MAIKEFIICDYCNHQYTDKETLNENGIFFPNRFEMAPSFQITYEGVVIKLDGKHFCGKYCFNEFLDKKETDVKKEKENHE